MISIIIPVYNVAPYLRECLESVISQTFKDWEGVLIDDGSTDDSGNICDEYVLKDKRFRVIHQENKGLTAVRNIGLDEAKGDYIAWIDSDDFVHPLWLGTLYDIITTHHCDISSVGYLPLKNGQNRPIAGPINMIYPAKPLSESQLINQIFSINSNNITPNVWPNVWTKLYCRKIIGNTRFSIDCAEDLDFNLLLFLKGSKVYCSKAPLYFYRLREGSITNSSDHDNKIYDLIIRCNVYDHYKVIDSELKYSQPILEYIYKTLLFAKSNDIYQNSPKSRENEKIYQEVLRRTYRDFIDCKGISSDLKRKNKLLHDYPRLYRFLIGVKKEYLPKLIIWSITNTIL